MKEICPSKAKTSSKSETAKPKLQKCASLEKSSNSKDDISKTDEIASPAFTGEISTTDSPATPLVGTNLLDAKRRKRNRSISKKPAGTESNSAPTDVEKAASTSNKRRKKSWTSLREIADSAEHDSSPKITNLTIPFCL
jgi:hypothetical protein